MNLQKIKTNLIIIMIILAIAGGYVFFLLSPRIFSESKDNLLNTPLGSPVSVGQSHSLTVESWLYCKKDREMEIILSFDTTASDPSEKYVYQVISRNSARDTKEVEYEVKYQSSKFSTLFIKNVPNDFNEMAVNVGYIDKHAEDEVSATDATTSSYSSSNNDVKAVFTTIFTNQYTVEITDKIEALNVIELYIGKINSENESLQEEIDGLYDDNDKLSVQQEDILERVSELRNSQEYVTEKESLKIEEDIKSYQNTYDSYQATIDSNLIKIDEYNDTILSNNEKIEELEEIKEEANKR